MFVRTIDELFVELSQLSEFRHRISINGSIIKIIFHEMYIVELTSSFKRYINSIFDYDIEDQDILDSMIDLARHTYVIQYKKIRPFKRRMFGFISKKSFDKKKWENKKNIMVISPDEVIVDTFDE